jgi:hypothetical protein
MQIFALFLFLICALSVNSCTTNKVIDVKSPCVSNEGGPCGPKKPVNTWLEQQKERA